MTSAKVVETSVNVTSNSPSQDYTHPDDHNLRILVKKMFLNSGTRRSTLLTRLLLLGCEVEFHYLLI